MPCQKQKIEMYIMMVVTIVKIYGTISNWLSLVTFRIVNFSKLMSSKLVVVSEVGSAPPATSEATTKLSAARTLSIYLYASVPVLYVGMRMVQPRAKMQRKNQDWYLRNFR